MGKAKEVTLKIANKTGFIRVLVQSLFSPPPPKGRFPDAGKAIHYPNGLLSVGGALTPEILIRAYSKGIFPYNFRPPVRWWSPDPRMVLLPGGLNVQQGLRRVVRQKKFNVTFDTDFRAVITACSDRDKTWINNELLEAFCSLHDKKYAHSVEVRNKAGELVGGLYGLALGKAFFTESLFTLENNASKVAFMYLNCHLQHWGFVMNDLQFVSGHWQRQGCVPISRDNYLKKLEEAVSMGNKQEPWVVDDRINVGAWQPQKSGSQLLAV